MKNKVHIPALEVSHLTVLYQETPVLSDITVTIPAGVMVGIIGPNGAGKTTFIKSVLGFVPRVSGVVRVAGSVGKELYKKVAYVPQRSTVDWDFPLTVFDMVLMGCYGKLGWFKRPTRDDHQRAHDALIAVGLDTMADAPIGTLSGGQQQRAFIARALLQDAQVYFLDEPFAGVDSATEKIIIHIFHQLRDAGKTVVVVHHDLMTAPFYFDWALLLNKKVIACGPVETVLTAEHLDQLYGTQLMMRAWDRLHKKDDAHDV
jgi:manganese/zinc/iron transport system ATP- binding protein